MPPNKSGKKHRSSAKKKANTDTPLENSATGYANLVRDIEGAEGWYPVVYTICKILNIDLSSRKGLKKIHETFAETTGNLDAIYVQYGDKDIIAQAVLAIYTRMCADGLLKDRLIKDSGLLAKAFALLNRSTCWRVALQALCAITHFGGKDVTIEIAKHTSSILAILEAHPDDSEAAELALILLSHTIRNIMGSETQPEQSIIRYLHLPRLLRLTTRELQKPNAPALLMTHSIPMISILSMHGYKEVKAQASAVNLLTAFSRASDISTRSEAVFGILRLYWHERDDRVPHYDPMKFLKKKEWPDHINEALFSYGPMRTDVFMALQAAAVFQKAITKSVQDHDFYALGRTVAPLIPSVEYSVVNGSFQVEDPRTGRWGTDAHDLGLPFDMWIDALPISANALRSRGGAENEVFADYLELKYLIASKKITEPSSIKKIKSAIERNPRNGYFYYVLSLCSNDREALRCAKKALSCPNLSDYLQNSLLCRSAVTAAHLGLEAVVAVTNWSNTHAQEEGVAVMKTAWEDAKSFIERASPDSRMMSTVIDWYIILTLVLYGPDISTDMRELKTVFDKLMIADDCQRHLEVPIFNTQARLGRIELVKRLPEAWKEWEAAVARYSKFTDSSEIKMTADEAKENLTVWLDTLDNEDGHDHTNDQHSHMIHPKISPNSVELYRCSLCKNPSAMLKKCSGCEKTRYCDASCQKEHWKAHRKTCKREGIANGS